MKTTEYKGYRITDGGFNNRVVEGIGSGVLPKALRGSFTSTAQAEHAIDKLGKTRGAKRGKSVSNTRG